MLETIICKKFVGVDINDGTLHFSKGLNVILGGENAENSIGKTTLMLIIDFCFGGQTYPTDEVLQAVHNHEIRWIMNYGTDDKPDRHFYGRLAFSPHIVIYYGENFSNAERKEMTLEYYRFDMNKHSKINEEVPPVIVTSLFMRIYGKPNIHLREPLRSYDAQKKAEAITQLERLMLVYHLFGESKERKAEFQDDIDLQNRLLRKQNNYAAKSKTDIDTNNAKIRAIRKRLKGLGIEENERISHERLEKDEKGANLKSQMLSLNRKKKANIESLDEIKSEKEGALLPNNEELFSLSRYFSMFDTEEIQKVQGFHISLVKLLRENSDAKAAQLEKDNSKIDKELKALEDQLTTLGIDPIYSQHYLQQKADLDRQILVLEDQNKGFADMVFWEGGIEKEEAKIAETEPQALKDIQSKLSRELKELNDTLYMKAHNPPQIILKDGEHYSFLSPMDEGTGTNYKNLILFDLSLLSISELPCVGHDSLLFKNIDLPIQRHLFHYYFSFKQKQIFVAYDNLHNIADKELEKKIEDVTICHLGKGETSLFGKDWGTEISPEEFQSELDLKKE